MAIDSRDEHPEKARIPIDLMVGGRVTDTKDEHPQKIKLPNDVTVGGR